MNIIDSLDNYEIVLPNLEYFYRINKRIAEKLIITLKRFASISYYLHIYSWIFKCLYIFRNNLLSTVKNLYESEEYVSVVDILKETLKPQSRTFMEIPSYQTMKRFNQYIYMLNSFLKLKNYHVCTHNVIKNFTLKTITFYRNYLNGVNHVCMKLFFSTVKV